MKLNFTKLLWVILVWILSIPSVFSQKTAALDIALAHMKSHAAEWGLDAGDIADYTVSDMYTDGSTGITRVYLLQRHAGIPVNNAILNFSITKDGKVFHVGKRFVQGLAAKVNTTSPRLSAKDALQKAMENLDIPETKLHIASQAGQQEFVFEKGNFASEDIPVKLRYIELPKDVALVWDVTIAPIRSSDMWGIRVDAVTGEILDKINYTVYCNPGQHPVRHLDDGSQDAAFKQHEAATYGFSTAVGSTQHAPNHFNPVAGATYNVFAPPVESPKHGSRTLVMNPADPIASPYGWHDTNGAPGAEFTITRGNNVWAYEDSGNTNASVNNEPNGGAGLVFDFPFNPALEPSQYTKASVTNMFFWGNYMHDFAYQYGFTEAAGNFQVNNYGKGGAGNDPVRMEAQDAAMTNNANFSTPSDGSSARMQVFLATNGGESPRHLTVNKPASVAGKYDTGLASNGTTVWGTGAFVTSTPKTGQVVVVDDGVEEPYSSDACEPIVNGAALAGKVALIDRGGCQFGFKAFQAQVNGAIGVIICNFEEDPINMAAGTHGNQVNIPVVMLGVVDCQTLRQFAGAGLEVTFVNTATPGPSQLDIGLDNGIVAHEYGHGISIRLTGGPSQSNCLEYHPEVNRTEQMGEGWSDFLAMATTVQPGDYAEKKRPVGAYGFSWPVDGRGIRRYPYSTDMEIYPLTYGDVGGSIVPHGVGEIWGAMLWDLYWAFVDEYGWDEDLFNGTGGNNLAIRLVFEGLKNQPCQPGFVDGRDAILAADDALNGGANKCLIWEVFARRGLGYSASQGTSRAIGDEKEAFDLLPVCRNAITVEKTVTDLINAGDDIEVSVYVGNFKQETLTGVTLTDELPDGTTFKAGSANVPASVQGNKVIFDLGSMAFAEEKTVTYQLTTAPENFSIRYFLDDVPDQTADDNWSYYFIGTPNATSLWSIQDIFAHSGDWAWFAEDIATESRQGLELLVPWRVAGGQPVLRFYHRYDTEAGWDGGLVDVKEAGTSTWKQVGDKMIRNGYPGPIQYTTFVVPNLNAFSGNSGNEFIGTYVDLSEWAGKDVVLRFRFGTDEEVGGIGWFVDDVEYMDMLNYNGEACLTTNQGDNVCVIAPEKGTIVESQLPPNATVEKLKDVTVAVYPNPTKNHLHIALDSERQQDLSVSLLAVDGKELMAKSANVFGNDTIGFNVSQLSRGIYFVKVRSAAGVLVKKVVID